MVGSGSLDTHLFSPLFFPPLASPSRVPPSCPPSRSPLRPLLHRHISFDSSTFFNNVHCQHWHSGHLSSPVSLHRFRRTGWSSCPASAPGTVCTLSVLMCLCSSAHSNAAEEAANALKMLKLIRTLGVTIGMTMDMFREFDAIIIEGLRANPHTPLAALTYQCVPFHRLSARYHNGLHLHTEPVNVWPSGTGCSNSPLGCLMSSPLGAIAAL